MKLFEKRLTLYIHKKEEEVVEEEDDDLETF